MDGKCKLCRKVGVKLFLKGERCFTPKCPIERKSAPVYQVGRRRRSQISEYGIQLQAKQKVKKIYGVRESQFKRYFEKARKVRESTGEALMQLLESRLDNVVFRLGFTPSRSVARQLVSHGHVSVDGKKVDIPSYQVKIGQNVAIAPRGLKIPVVIEELEKEEVVLPLWLEKKAVVGRMKRLPNRDEIEADINEQAVVEYYSR